MLVVSRYPDRVTMEWPVDRSVLPELPDPADPDYPRRAAERADAETLSCQVMHALSGRQFGLVTVIARPDTGAATCLPWGPAWWDRLRVAEGAASLRRVVTLDGPVHDVTTVTVADTALPADSYAVEGNRLIRRGGAWPAQDLGRPLGEVNTWSVTYRRGLVPPAGAARLTAMLAAEMLKAMAAMSGAKDTGCRLPRTVTTVSRNNVTYRAYDPATLYATGKTGLPEVDLWLASVNPRAVAQPARVV